VVCPEHHRTFKNAGWTKARLYEELYRLCEIPGDELAVGAKGIAEGGPPSLAGKMTVLLEPDRGAKSDDPAAPAPAGTARGIDDRDLDIAKRRGDVFLQRLGERLAERGIAVRHYAKPTNTRVAPLPLRQQIAAEVNVVVEGLSD
jgi:hypothetical protein